MTSHLSRYLQNPAKLRAQAASMSHPFCRAIPFQLCNTGPVAAVSQGFSTEWCIKIISACECEKMNSAKGSRRAHLVKYMSKCQCPCQNVIRTKSGPMAVTEAMTILN